MEAVIFIGIQGSGKSTFYAQRFSRTHMRINLDMLKTRHRESVFIQTCLDTGMRFVVDNTNPTSEERAQYIAPARTARFRIVGYYFAVKPAEALVNNASRAEAERVPNVAIFSTYKRLQLPSYGEGFDALYYVTSAEGAFCVEEWRDEL
jgi:predicted kinase